MAGYHFHAGAVTRSKGQSVVAKAAYNARAHLVNENTGDHHDYRYKGVVLFSCFFVPKDAPKWVQELTQKRQTFWSFVEAAEKRKDSQMAREIEIALPDELTNQQREFLVIDFVKEILVRLGMIADVSIHAPGGKGDIRNYHAHILLTMRSIGRDGFGPKVREWNSKKLLRELREQWAIFANRHLELHGHEERIDHRSLKDQGIDREPTIHLGPTATSLERRGLLTERGNKNREIRERNRRLEQLKAAVKELSAEIEEAERQLAIEIQEQQRREDLNHAEEAPNKKTLHNLDGQPENGKYEKNALPLMVVKRVPGKISVTRQRLTDFVQTIPNKTAHRQIMKEERLVSPAAEQEYRLQDLAKHDRKVALGKIKQGLQENRDLEAEDIRNLSREDIDGIKTIGDDYLRVIVRQRELQRAKRRERGRGR